jgi:aspartate/methionine/tyrosine aminotransferase
MMGNSDVEERVNASRESLHGSEYMEWFKTSSQARFNLSVSGVRNLRLRDFPIPLKNIELELTGPGGYGYEPLQKRIAGKAGVSTDCVVATSGASMANHLVMALLAEPGSEFLIEHPTYELLVSTARYLGADVRRFRRPPIDFCLSAEEVERSVTDRTRLIVLTDLHNPSSAPADDASLREVGDIALRVGAHVLVVEAYADARFDPDRRCAFHLGPQFITTTSLTKVYGLGGLRCGWVVARPEMAKKLWKLNNLFAAVAPHITELLSVVALDHLDIIGARSRELLERNRRVLNEFLASRDDLEAKPHGSGTISFPRWIRGNTDPLCALLQARYDTSVGPGRFFGLSEHVRIGIGMETSTLVEGLERLGQALDGLAGTRVKIED